MAIPGVQVDPGASPGAVLVQMARAGLVASVGSNSFLHQALHQGSATTCGQGIGGTH